MATEKCNDMLYKTATFCTAKHNTGDSQSKTYFFNLNPNRERERKIATNSKEHKSHHIILLLHTNCV